MWVSEERISSTIPPGGANASPSVLGFRNPNSPLVETPFPGLFGPAHGEKNMSSLNE